MIIILVIGNFSAVIPQQQKCVLWKEGVKITSLNIVLCLPFILSEKMYSRRCVMYKSSEKLFSFFLQKNNLTLYLQRSTQMHT